MEEKKIPSRPRRRAHHFFDGHPLLLLVLIMASASSVLILTDSSKDYNNTPTIASLIDNYSETSKYLSSWYNFGPGGGGFTTDIRVAPKGFFGLKEESRVYLANDMNGVFRSTELNTGRGAVTKWEHVWYPEVNEPVEMPTKYVSSIAFTNNYGNQNTSRLLSGTREGIFSYSEQTKSWLPVSLMPNKTYLEQLGLFMEKEDGNYPWVSVIREVPWANNLLIAGIGDHRESYSIGKRRFGQSSVLRSRDGGDTWDLVRLPTEDPKEVVFDIKYLNSDNSTGVFLVTGKNVYISKNFFSNETPSIVSISKRSIVGPSNTPEEFELRSVEVLPSSVIPADADSETDHGRIFVSVHSSNSDFGGIYEAEGALLSESAPTSLVWTESKMDTNKSERYIGRIIKTEGSTAENYKLYVSKFNNPYLLVKTNSMKNWETIVDDSSSSNAAYEADQKRSAFGMIEAMPLELSQTKEPTILGAWSFGPIFAPGHNGEIAKKRAYVQMFSYKHHDFRATEFFGSRGFEEINFIGSIPEIKPREPGTIMLAAPDNGILLSHDFGKTWSVRTPRSATDWQKDYQTTLVAGYQVRFHPVNTQCVIASVGPNRFGFGSNNLGELVVNKISGYGGSDSWQTLAGGSARLNGLPNAEIHAMTFDVKTEADGTAGIFVGVRGHGIYYAKMGVDCSLKNVEGFKKLNDPKITSLIPGEPGAYHYYSQVKFDPFNSDVLYISRSYPGGGVFRLVLGSDSSSRTDSIQSFEEIILGSMNENGVEYCPINRSQNRYRASDVNYITVTKDHVFAAMGYGLAPDASERNERCKSDPTLSSTRAANYYGGLIRFSKNTPIKNNRSSAVNEWILGGPDNVGGLPMKVFQIGAIEVNPARQNEIIAVTTGGRFPTTRSEDGIVEGDEDAKLSGLFISEDGGSIFKFYPWGMKFPNALSMKFSDNGKRLYMPTRGNGLWIWQSPR